MTKGSTIRKTVAFSKHASNIFFHITTACNLHCRHCYINPHQHGHGTLSPEVIKRRLAMFHARSHAPPNLILLGGEPTLHPELPAIVTDARRMGYRSVTVDTNGYLFHDFLGRVSPHTLDVISFSLDGPGPAINDPIRGEGSFAVCVDGIRRAVKQGFCVSVIYTVSRNNLSGLSDMVPLLEDLGVDRFFIQVIGIRGKSATTDNLQLTGETWRTVVPEVARRVAEQGIIATYPKVFLDPGEPFVCAGLTADNYFVFPNGRVYRCPLCEDYPLHALTIEDDALVETPKINETDLFPLTIPEGCIMNRLIQPDNIEYDETGACRYPIACCMLKEEVIQT